ncbi:PucR family transcriptional regulator [Bacillus sp. 2205SS5-2]|uniref:PucR family transcriptional regulator n=1 Tax=Bacillus sp. 2205SS5-2 TaxID=3109031 RepID=UPI003007AFF8
MRKKFQLTLEHVLSRKNFQFATVLAGKQGLQHSVKWVHVVEATNIHKLLTGHELILSTGLAWTREETFLSIIDQLIENDAAGLCIELGTTLNEIPLSVLTKAEKHSFPLIVFEKEVSFVKITQDIHTTIINQQYSMISDLENYAQLLNKKLLTISNYKEILQFLYDYIETPILFRYKELDFECYPAVPKEKQNQLIASLTQSEDCSSKVNLFEEEFAEIFLLRTTPSLSDFEHLLLDRTATALAQFFLRELFFEEKKRMNEAKWVEGWLSGNHNSRRVQDYLKDLNIHSPINGGVVCLCSYDTYVEKEKMDLTYFQLFTRSVFEQQGFVTITENLQHQQLFILLDTRDPATWKERMKKALNRMNESQFVMKNSSSSLYFSVGKYTNHLSSIHKSYESTLQTIKLKPMLPRNLNYSFFDELHLYRIISELDKNMDLSELIQDYLAPILEYDKTNNGKLLETLKIYLNSHGCKKETAKQLFIVRQTLYHRLNKIENLLGNDFMRPNIRLTLELILLAYDFINQEEDFATPTQSNFVLWD